MRRRSKHVAVEAESEDLLRSFDPAQWAGQTAAEKFDNWLAATLDWMQENNPDYQQNPLKYLAQIPDAPFDGTGV